MGKLERKVDKIKINKFACCLLENVRIRMILEVFANIFASAKSFTTTIYIAVYNAMLEIMLFGML